MKNIETEILIHASKSQVWKVLMDFENYGTWNPFIKEIAGPAIVSDFLDITIEMKPGSSMNFKPVVLKADANIEFRWKGKLFVKGLFDGEHYFILEEQADGKTLLKHGESFTGLMANPLYTMISGDTKRGFESMNVALKAACERVVGEEVLYVG